MDHATQETHKKEKYGAGLTIFMLLGVFTIGEFLVGAIGANWAGVFIGIALLKAYLVIRDYMHFGRLVSGEEGHS